MAIKIRCVDCKKKISIDEAFAGGVCRCPYCTAIVYVPDESATSKRKRRPEVPTRRPEAPTPRPKAAPKPGISKADTAVGIHGTADSKADTAIGIHGTADSKADTAVGIHGPADATADTAVDVPATVDSQADTAVDVPAIADAPGARKPETQAEADKALAVAHGQANIPTAAPVRVQGIVSMILAVLLLGMIAGMVVLAMDIMTPPVVDNVPEDYEYTTFTTRADFPAVAGTIKVEAPVVYCIDTSKPMAQVLESAGKIALASAKSLKGGKFNLILLGEDDDKILSPQPIASDKAGIAKAQAFLSTEWCGAAEQARGLQAALDMKAKTVVLLARDSDPGAKGLAEGAFKDKSVRLHTIVLGGSSGGLTELAKLTGGESKSYTASELETQAQRAEEELKKK